MIRDGALLTSQDELHDGDQVEVRFAISGECEGWPCAARRRGAAVMEVRRHNAAFCRDCFLHYVGQQVTRAIAKYRMLGHTDRVLVGLGKDSLALWDLLLELGWSTAST